MIFLLGASGYVGQAFQDLFRSRDLDYFPVSRRDLDYYDPGSLATALREKNAVFLINAAGYTGKPNVDACEVHKAECLEGNAVLPGRIREACEMAGVPWGHVSSGCIYDGSKSSGRGFTEEDPPNFSFRSGPCSFYSGTKALGEEMLASAENCYIWRLRIPFEHRNTPRNYLAKLMNYERLLDAENSISHLGDFVASCLACWEGNLPFETYNLTNHGTITTREVVSEIQRILAPEREFHFFRDEKEFMQVAAKTPRSNCVLDSRKAKSVDLPMRSVEDALEDALRNWAES